METVQRRKFPILQTGMRYDYADSIVIHCDDNSYDTEIFWTRDYYGGCGYSAYGYLIRTQNRELSLLYL